MSPRRPNRPLPVSTETAPPGRSLTDQVYDLLKEEIIRGERPPGDILSEYDLAEKFQVSKTPVREALRLLAQGGWVIVMPRKGYLVQPLGLDDVREIFAIRGLIEPSIAAQAASAGNADAIRRLRALVEEQADAGDDLDRALGSARLFHITLAETAANGRMRRILSELVDEVRRLHFLLPNVESHITSQEELQAHRSIAEAIANGDSQQASELMRVHLIEVARTLVLGFAGL
jgi:GntR family transcriptional regulator, rspAB operon transcriptional repressor